MSYEKSYKERVEALEKEVKRLSALLHLGYPHTAPLVTPPEAAQQKEFLISSGQIKAAYSTDDKVEL